jgi:transposase InsO family protein
VKVHKNTRLTEVQRRRIWKEKNIDKLTVTELSRRYLVSRHTIYKVLERARKGEFTPRDSTNHRFKCVKYGFKRLKKVEEKILKKLAQKAKRYEKSYPGEMVHGDTKRLPLLKKETKLKPREYLFVSIEDFSRELYAGIYEDKSQVSSAKFLNQIIKECPYKIEVFYSDNGKEYRGNAEHEFVSTCRENRIAQRFTRPRTPKTNGKAERVIRTLIESWHKKNTFKSRFARKKNLVEFVNWYNTEKPHKGISGKTPHQKLEEYFSQEV